MAKKKVKKQASRLSSKSKSKINVMIHASFLYTGQGVLEKDGRNLKEQDLAPIKDGALVYTASKILWAGPTAELPKKYAQLPAANLKNKQAIMPGLIDSHTHLVFAGSRASEFAKRCAGASYQDIAAAGGGIQTSVNATRDESFDTLYDLALKRAKIAHSFGVRTIECKSGYGLTHESEIKCLKVIKALQKNFPHMTFVSTYLGAHSIPKEKSKEDYLREMIEQTLPEVARLKLAEIVDVFVDEGYFTVEDARKLLGSARSLGLKLKVHADELSNTESTQLAVDLKALSADHLLKISAKSRVAIAKSSTVATLLPGTAFYLKEPYAPARALLDAGAKVAVSTDFNPGSCYSLNLPLMMNLSALYMKMNVCEIFASVTYNAASALGLEKSKGVLAEGYDSDFIVLPYDTFEEMYYRLGW